MSTIYCGTDGCSIVQDNTVSCEKDKLHECPEGYKRDQYFESYYGDLDCDYSGATWKDIGGALRKCIPIPDYDLPYVCTEDNNPCSSQPQYMYCGTTKCDSSIYDHEVTCNTGDLIDCPEGYTEQKNIIPEDSTETDCIAPKIKRCVIKPNDEFWTKLTRPIDTCSLSKYEESPDVVYCGEGSGDGDGTTTGSNDCWVDKSKPNDSCDKNTLNKCPDGYITAGGSYPNIGKPSGCSWAGDDSYYKKCNKDPLSIHWNPTDTQTQKACCLEEITSKEICGDFHSTNCPACLDVLDKCQNELGDSPACDALCDVTKNDTDVSWKKRGCLDNYISECSLKSAQFVKNQILY